MNFKISYTLCWDCAKAIGQCSWSKDLTPVEGWDATLVKGKIAWNGTYDGYIVKECPEFKRDAYRGGTIRYNNPEVTQSE